MRLNRLTIFFASLFLALSPFPVSAQQYSYDAVVRQGSITFSRSDLYAGEPVRVYGNIINLGIQDIAGTVTFYQGAIPLGNPLPFSLRAQSASEDFWVDWTPTEGTYNIMMGISSTNPEDQNPSNNTAVTSVMTITKRPPPPPPPPPLPTPKPVQPIAQVTTGSQPSNINTTSKPQSKTIIETADEIQTSSSRKLGVIQKPVKTKTSLPIKKGVIANQLITANSDVDVLKNDALVDSAIALLSSTEKLSADSTPIRNEVDTNSAAPRYPSSPESNQGAVLIIILSVLAAISLAGGAVFWGLSRRK